MVAIKKGRGGISIPDVPERKELAQIVGLVNKLGENYLTLHASDDQVAEWEMEVSPQEAKAESGEEIDSALAELAGVVAGLIQQRTHTPVQ